jgi:hypothetical protein
VPGIVPSSFPQKEMRTKPGSVQTFWITTTTRHTGAPGADG